MKLSFLRGPALVATFLMVLCGFALAEVTLSVEAEDGSAEVILENVGDQVAVNVKAKVTDDEAGVFGFELVFDFDPAIVDLVEAEEGDFLKAGGDQTFYGNKPGGGFATKLGGDAVKGEGILIKATFEVKDLQEGEISLKDVLLSDAGAAKIEDVEIIPLALQVEAVAPPSLMVVQPNPPRYVGDELTFDGSGSTDPEGDPLTYKWDFGDGKEAEGEKATKIYDTAGKYQVTLTVSDSINEPQESVTTVEIVHCEAIIKEHEDDSQMIALEAKFPAANELGKAYIDVWKGEITVETGMFLEYQIAMYSGNPHFKAGVEVHATDGTVLGNVPDLGEVARDKWVHQKVSLDTLDGKTIDVIMVATESTEHLAGLFRAYFDNMQLTDGACRKQDIYIDGDNIPATGAPESDLSDTMGTEGVEDAKAHVTKIVAVQPAGKLVTTWASLKSF
jgi:PKD repeat protein